MTDEELALSYTNGSNRAFDILLERNQSKLFSYILFVVRDREQANDLFQEGKYTTTGKFGAWIMRIAHNVIMDWYRSKRSDKTVEQSNDNDLSKFSPADLLDLNVENRYVNDQVMSDVKKIMNLLPATQREVVFMRFYQDLSFKEIAELTNVSINTALGRMRYAILNMRRIAKAHNVVLQLD